MSLGLEDELARFATELRWSDLPAEAQDRVRVLWTDSVANALVGRASPSSLEVERIAVGLTGHGEATVVGGGGASTTAALFVNAHQTTVYTMCDVYRPALCHITPEVFPVVLAVAEELDASGVDLLAAFAVGLEVTARIGRGLDYATFRARGWHAPGVIGPFGAVAAASSLLGLDVAQVRGAFGLALSQAGGTFAALGTSAVKFHQARGAVAGLWATRFAAEGRGGTPRALTHEDGGLLSAYADGGEPDAIVADLGTRWELMEVALRRWPASSSLQTTIEAVLAARTAVGDAVPDVERIVVRLPNTSYDMCAHMGWGDELEAMQSARFVASAVMHDGRVWIDQYRPERRADRQVTALAHRDVEVERADDLPAASAEVVVHERSGASHRERREIPIGDPRRPLERDDVASKLAAAMATVPPRGGDDVRAWLTSLPDAVQVGAGIRALRGNDAVEAVPSPEPAICDDPRSP